MSAFWKRLVSLTAVLGGVAILSLWAVNRSDVGNYFKADITRRVSAQLHRAMSVDSDLIVKLWPQPAIELHDVTLADATGFGDAPMFQAKQMHLGLRWLSLLIGRVELDTVTSRNVALKLRRNSDGHTNWQDLITADAAHPDTMAELPPIEFLELADVRIDWHDAQSGQQWHLNDLNLAVTRSSTRSALAVRLKTAIDVQQDEMGGTLDLTGTLDPPTDDTRLTLQDFKLDSVLHGKRLPTAPVQIKAAGTLTAVLPRHELKLTDLAVTGAGVWATGTLGIDNFLDPLAGLNYDLHLKAPDSQTLWHRLVRSTTSRLNNIDIVRADVDAHVRGSTQELTVLDARVNGQIRAANSSPVVNLDWQSAKARFDLPTQQLLEIVGAELALHGGNMVPIANALGVRPTVAMSQNLGVQLRASIAGNSQQITFTPLIATLQRVGNPAQLFVRELGINASGHWTKAADALILDSISLHAPGLDVSGVLTLSDLFAMPKAEGHLETQPFHLRRILTAMGLAVPATTDPDVLAETVMNGNFRISEDALHLADLHVQVDQTTANGDLAIEHFSNPSISSAMTIDSLDADRYVPRQESKDMAPPVRQASDPGNILSILQELTLTGRVRIGELRIGGAKLQKVEFTAAAADGTLRLEPFTTALYGGLGIGRMAVTTHESALNGVMAASLQHVHAGDLLSDLGQGDAITGTLSLEGVWQGEGRHLNGFIESISGAAEGVIRDGRVRGFDPASQLANLYSARPVTGSARHGTAFDKVAGRIKWAGRQVSSEALSFHSSSHNYEVSGHIDLTTGKAYGRLQCNGPEHVITSAQVSGTWPLLQFHAPLDRSTDSQPTNAGTNRRHAACHQVPAMETANIAQPADANRVTH